MPSLNDSTRGRLLFGGDYNPEQWPQEIWSEDVALMKAAGVNSVTLGVFSWSKLEPRPGARDFGWLDRLMDLMETTGIGVVLATPTASPPPWMGARHPETLPRDEDGRTVWWGSRQQFCPSSPVYRTYAAALTEDLALRYGGHPALRMWHINNEYCTHCWCDETGRHFRRWLRARHGSLDALNESWGTAFWSQRYDSWEEIIPPRRAQYMRNPGQVLDFRRFTSDALLECYTAERDIVRRHTPHTPVTSNFMPLWSGQDAWRWAEEEDVVSVDIYPDPRDEHGGQYNAMIGDMTRSQAGGPWVLMEQAAGPVNWRGVNHPKPRGLNRLWSLQSVAHGADAICYFQWRQSRQGAEKFHSGMLNHAGEQGRIFQEIKRIGADLALLGPYVAGGRVRDEVAVLHDWDSWWADQQDGRLSSCLDYAEIVRAWHRALWESNLPTGFARPGHDLSAYRMVVVPHLY
ncbi:beta-galactosidase, partial [Streptomyces sp. NPDC087850]